MGVWKQVKALLFGGGGSDMERAANDFFPFLPEKDRMVAIQTIVLQRRCYLGWRMKLPERDRHAWLAKTLRSCYGAEKLETAYYSSTFIYSVLDEARCPAALGIWILSNENPQVEQLRVQHKMLIEPAVELLRSGTFLNTWRNLNPWTAANHPHLESAITAMAEDHGCTIAATYRDPSKKISG